MISNLEEIDAHYRKEIARLREQKICNRVLAKHPDGYYVVLPIEDYDGDTVIVSAIGIKIEEPS